jgi:hypothetical protein
MLNHLETFEGWLLIVFSDDQGYHFQCFNPLGENAGKVGAFVSVPCALHSGRKFLTGEKLKG